ncbi:hypothetical protein WR25_06061 [Diploscapter pachys]|uniref:Nematode cuticle collagen N-terminal domain-containing protein n=1 Tax=Diploscapter pachys TaxID=2018661 RepID=A0A2A2LNM5_9BILA|nr:hypothetical protein WR25_06061 [Diploscapter pachys]
MHSNEKIGGFAFSMSCNNKIIIDLQTNVKAYRIIVFGTAIFCNVSVLCTFVILPNIYYNVRVDNVHKFDEIRNCKQEIRDIWEHVQNIKLKPDIFNRTKRNEQAMHMGCA